MSLQVLDGGRKERNKSKFEQDIFALSKHNTGFHIGISLKSSRKLRTLLDDYIKKDDIHSLDWACFMSQIHCAASQAAHNIMVKATNDENHDFNQNIFDLLIMELLKMKNYQAESVINKLREKINDEQL